MLDCEGCAWKAIETCRVCRAEQEMEVPEDKIERIRKRCDDILRSPKVIDPPAKSMRIVGTARAILDYAKALTYEPMVVDSKGWDIRLLIWKN